MTRQVPIFCNRCKFVDILDLNQYNLFVSRKWDLIWQNLTPDKKQSLRQMKIPGPLELYINIKRLGKLLKEKGSLDYGCRKCIAEITDQWYRNHGYNSVRYGNIVVDINFYEQHTKEVNHLIEEMKTK
jgi:hypothetical protein